ncbi:rhamnulokinase [Brachybacterium sacelli]|uniref:Rhamnulokinase n=1 Tax=Brachybacterium sacelli TaxID=173364 RepID=A0ABS4WWQ3_9MICO|nr:rhamnulokinase family protein [Brachybacterium sacelli]MBP2380393.1 rhamnulokinase [Brachybacterium sacelli]
MSGPQHPHGPSGRGPAEVGPAASGRAGPCALAAVDLGATSGRVMLGVVVEGRIELVPAHRFDNHLVRVDGHLCWDLDALWTEIRRGLRAAHDLAVGRGLGGLSAIGVDSWAVDYALVGPDERDADGFPDPGSGTRRGEVIAYRDHRTDGVAETFAQQVSRQRQYALTGIAQQPFNTLYQLLTDDRVAGLPAGSTLLMLPDAIGHLLTGQRRTELTNASSTGMLRVGGDGWAEELLAAAGVDRDLLAPFIAPGEVLGTVRPALAGKLGIGDVPVIAVGSHDTASAVLAVPAHGDGPVAYISSGTWSLIGLELPPSAPTTEALEAGFTHEGGIDGTVRFLKNVAGMWLVSESIRQWQDEGLDVDLEGLLAEAATGPPARALIDPTDPQFLAPGRMADRVIAAARPTGARPSTPDPVLTTPAEVVRCLLESLAQTYREELATACRLAGVARPERLYVVGGGSQNALLNQLTADALGLEVVAGPMEATALGNLALQAAALGAVPAGRSSIRELVRASVELETFQPSPA